MTARPLTTPQDLAKAGLIAPPSLSALRPVAARYAISVTDAVRRSIEGDPERDPVARQYVPSADELLTLPEERADPIDDVAHSPVPGLVHRYHDRVLLKIVAACPVYCRFCFRREMVGPGQGGLTPAEIEAALDYVSAHPQIREIILTGGDPFLLSERRVRALLERISAISHIDFVRWHTRVPVADPERVSADFALALASARMASIVALHINHPQEITAAARDAIGHLRRAGVNLLSQSVLLRGVNDHAQTLEALMRAFIAEGIQPYYLHHGDLAPGTSHFRTSIREGQALMRDLAGRLPGYAVPRYVLDVPGGGQKVDLLSRDVEIRDDGRVQLRAADGRWVDYPVRETAR